MESKQKCGDQTVLLIAWHHLPILKQERSLTVCELSKKILMIMNTNVYVLFATSQVNPVNGRMFESLGEIKDLKTQECSDLWNGPESADHLVGVHFSLILSFWLCSILHRGIYIGHRNEGFLVRHRCSNELFTTFCLFRLCLSQPMCGQRGNERKCSTMSNLFFFLDVEHSQLFFFSAGWNFSWLKSPCRRPWHFKVALVGGMFLSNKSKII